MVLRHYQPGDEAAQVSIYNEATAALPKFKPATVEETRRRCQAAHFDPHSRFFVVEADQIVGYASFHANGRISYPWCRTGHEHWAKPLLEAVLQAMRERGLRYAFAAYRPDWTAVREFFLEHGFRQAREMVNFWLDPMELPTPAGSPSYRITPADRHDIEAIFELARSALRVCTPRELEQHLFNNASFPPEAVFVARALRESAVCAAGILVTGTGYADPRQVDANMPCYRLGAFGTEGMQTKRIQGLFSFVARADSELPLLGLELLTQAAARLERTASPALAGQVPSDVPHLLRFYEQHFHRQGSFPVYERTL